MQYKVAGHIIEVDCVEGQLHILLPNFDPFVLSETDGGKPLMRLRVEEKLVLSPDLQCHLIRDVDTGNGMTKVEKLNDGGYQFLVRDIYGFQCALLVTNPKFTECRVEIRGTLENKRFALNNSLMMAFAFCTAYLDTLLIHASVIRHNGLAYAFTAKSGTGKSTQVANWLRYVEGSDMINDDNPVIRMVDGKPVLFGSPWSGKTPCYRNVQVPLGAVLLIVRDDYNHVEPMTPISAFSTLLTACSTMKWDEALYSSLCDTVAAFVEHVRMAELHCLPDGDSALTCRQYLEG